MKKHLNIAGFLIAGIIIWSLWSEHNDRVIKSEKDQIEIDSLTKVKLKLEIKILNQKTR